MNVSLRGSRWGGLDRPLATSGLFQSFLVERGKSRLALELCLDDALLIASGQDGFSDAVELVSATIAMKRPIFIFGDYDVDGMTSVSIWLRVLQALGAPVEVMIPKRCEGYGLSHLAVQRALEAGAALLICVDSGTDRVLEIAAARDAGLSTLVIDHHLPKGGRAEASMPDVLINGHFSQDPMLARLCAAGQSFAVASAVLDRNGSHLSADMLASVRRHLLQFAMVGTISDMMDIGPGFNRAVVAAGLDELRLHPVPSLKALLKAIFPGEDEKIGASTISFGIGPAINSAGRFSEPSIAIGLLMSDDELGAEEFAKSLVSLNDRRKELQSQMFEEAMVTLDRTRTVAAYVGDDWEKGLVGLVASGIVDALHRPALAATRLGDTIYGSGRSIPGFDLGRAVIAAHKAGIILGGGGHAAACGFQCAPDQWDSFVQFIARELANADSEPTHFVDLMIEPAALTVEEISAFNGLSPYGQGWAPPVVGVRSRLHDIAVIGKNKDTLRVNAGFKGVAFRASHNGLMKLLEYRGRDAVIIGEPVVSEFGGALSAEMRIRDVVVL